MKLNNHFLLLSLFILLISINLNIYVFSKNQKLSNELKIKNELNYPLTTPKTAKPSSVLTNDDLDISLDLSTYPAILSKEKDSLYNIVFQPLDNINSYGPTVYLQVSNVTQDTDLKQIALKWCNINIPVEEVITGCKNNLNKAFTLTDKGAIFQFLRYENELKVALIVLNNKLYTFFISGETGAGLSEKEIKAFDNLVNSVSVK